MKLSKFKEIFKEEVNSETKNTLSEGIVDKLVSAIIDKVVHTKYKKFFDTLKNDPEYQEKLRAVKIAATEIDRYGEAAVKAKEKADKSYAELVKKYGKDAADNIMTDVRSNKMKWGNWSDEDRKRYTGKSKV